MATRRAKTVHATAGNGLILNPVNPKREDVQIQILIGTPTLGVIRIEWYNAMMHTVTPPNWSTVRSTPVGYSVGDAQNMLVDSVIRGPFRALLLIEDDTVPPQNALLEFDRWLWKMDRFKAPPVVSGVYHIKGSQETRKGDTGGIEQLGPEPLVYRGGGQRAFRDFKYGDVVWCSGVPTGAILIHRKVLEAWAREPDLETYSVPGYPYALKKIFQQPSRVWVDDDGGHHAEAGTTDLYWSAETIRRDILTKAGWPKKLATKQYPYIVDTSMRFGHIDRGTGLIT